MFSQAPHQQQPSTSAAELPSPSFLRQNVKTERQKEKLAQLVAEMQMLREFFGGGDLREFTDDDWEALLEMRYSNERADYLLSMRSVEKEETQAEMEKEDEKISVLNQRKYDAGEMVYARHFNEYIELYGQDFRNFIENTHGARILSRERLDEAIQLLVDCRYVPRYPLRMQRRLIENFQTLYEKNWASREPFRISFANFRPDQQCAALMKRYLLFLYGPKRLQSERSGPFQQSLFAPSVSPQELSHFANCRDPEETLYVSWRAVRFLPDRPPMNLKNIIICASDDRDLVASSASAAAADRIIPYRIPFERYAPHYGHLGTKLTLPLHAIAGIMGDWVRTGDWTSAIADHVGPRRVLTPDEMAKRDDGLKREEFFKLAMKDFEVSRRRDEVDRRNVATRAMPLEGGTQMRHRRANPEEVDGKTKRKHRYTREERNARRAAEAAAGN
ncbi:unnamed protein product, partial [Mesorhabditis spiculigera]